MKPTPQPTVENVIEIFQEGMMKIQKSLADYSDSFKPLHDCETTPLFWVCECVSLYLHTKDENRCPICEAYEEDQPDAMIKEVLTAVTIWCQSVRAERERLLDQSTAKIFRWEEKNGYDERLGGADE